MNRRFFTPTNKRRIPGSFNRAGALLVLALVLFAGVLGAIRPALTSAASSSTLTFQARLLNTSGSLVTDGTYNVEFKIYDTVASGASAQGVCSLDSSTDDCWWVETRTGGNKVTVKNGYVYANLGSVTAFSSTIPWDQELWITMNIGGTGSPSWDGEMSPRFKVAAVPYAFAAQKLQVTDSAITNKLVFATPSASNKTITLPNETGVVCTTGSVCSGYQASGSYLTAESDTLATVTGRGATTSVASSFTGGLTVSGAASSINASSNFATNINTGTSTGAVSIGSSVAGAVALQSASTIGLTGTTSITGLTSGVALTVSNSTSTGNIINFNDNATTVFSVADGGTVSARTINPTTDDTYDLGSTSLRWRDLYLGPDSLHIGASGNEAAISYNTTSSYLKVDASQVRFTGDVVADTAPTADFTTSYRTITPIDGTDDVGQYTSIALGSDGFARISYYDVTNGDLKFIQCTNADCGTKNTTTVDSTGDVGRYTSIALGSDGFARISYYDVTNANLKFIQCTNASCSTKNTTVVDSTGDVGQYTSIALGSDGFARISYYDVTNANLKFIQCTNADCSTKNTTAVDSTGSVGTHTSIVIAPDGFARISYYYATSAYLKLAQCTNASCSTRNATVIASGGTFINTSIKIAPDGFARISYYDGGGNTDIKFAQCTNTSCSTKNTTTVDSTGDVGQYTSIALDSNGFARISYYDVTNADLKFVQCVDAGCNSSAVPVSALMTTSSNFEVNIVDSIGDLGSSASMTLGSDGFARISYSDGTNADLKFAQCTNSSCSTVNTTTVDSTGNVGTYTSIALGSDTFARISYYDSTNQNLKFVQCTNADCSTKNTTTVDSTVGVGYYTSIAIASDGFARISYYDATNQDLKFIQCTNASCSTKNTTTVDSTGNVGQYTSIALGSDGFARISYYDGTNADLKFIQCTNASCSTKNTTTVDSTGNVGYGTSIILGSDGFARISHHNFNGGLRFIQCTNASCSTKNTTTFSDTGTLSYYGAPIALGSDGFARISYRNATGDLSYIRCTNADCSTKNTTVTIDSAGDVGIGSSIALGSDGFARISYYDSTNADLKFAQCLDAGCSSSVSVPNNSITGPKVGSVTDFFAQGFFGYLYAKQAVLNGFDVAETYKVTDTSIEAGDVVVLAGGVFVDKSVGAYAQGLMGVVSTQPGLTLGEWAGDSNTRPVALAGRVPVKVTNENGAIQPGDYLTSSATKPGYAMKATGYGQVIGRALEAFNETEGKVLMFVGVAQNAPSSSQLLEGTSIANLTVTNTLTARTVYVEDMVVSSSLTIHGKIITAGITPTVVIGASTTGDGSTYIIEGNDTTGSITLNTGTSTATKPLAAGEQATITFAVPFTTSPRVTLTPITEQAGSINFYITKSATGFKIIFNSTPASNSSYGFDYHILQ